MNKELIQGSLKMGSLENIVKRCIPATIFMAVAGIADSMQTYHNIMKNGLIHEGNPLIRSLIEATSVEAGLILPKVVVGMLAFGISTYSIIKKEQERNYLMYFAGGWWWLGFLSNYYYS